MTNTFRREIEALKTREQTQWVEVPEAEYKRAQELVPPEEFKSKFKKGGDTSVYGEGVEYFRLEQTTNNGIEDSELALWLTLKQDERLKQIEDSVSTIKWIMIVGLIISILVTFVSCAVSVPMHYY